MGHPTRQDFKYNNWDFPVSSWQAHNAFTARTGIGRYGNSQSFQRMHFTDARSNTAMSPGIQPKQKKWLWDRGHPQYNYYTRMSNDGQIRSTESNSKTHRIFRDTLLRSSVQQRALISGCPVQTLAGWNYRIDSFNEFRGVGGLINSESAELDDQRIEDKKIMEKAKREYVLTHTQRNNKGMTLKKPILNTTTMQDTFSQQKRYLANSIRINSVLPHAHHREIESFKKMSTQNDDMMSLSSKFQSIVTSEPPEDTKSKRSFLAKLSFSRRKHKPINLNDQPSCSNQSNTTQNPKFGFLKRLFGSRT